MVLRHVDLDIGWVGVEVLAVMLFDPCQRGATRHERGHLRFHLRVELVTQLLDVCVLLHELLLQLGHPLKVLLLMNWMVRPLLDELFHDSSEPEALVMVGLDLLVVLFGPSVLDILPQYLQLFIPL